MSAVYRLGKNEDCLGELRFSEGHGSIRALHAIDYNFRLQPLRLRLLAFSSNVMTAGAKSARK